MLKRGDPCRWDEQPGYLLNTTSATEPIRIPAGTGKVLAVAFGDRISVGGLEDTTGKPERDQVSYIVRSGEYSPFGERFILWLVDVSLWDGTGA